MTIEAWKKCPVCGKTENQVRAGYNRSGSQRCKCKECGKYYTINPKQHTYPEETRKLALKMYYGGISGRSVGKILHMNKSNVMNWIKKARCKENLAPKQTPKIVEMDELYWFLKYKPRTETRENIYLITLVSRNPRQILGYTVSPDKSAETLQKVVDMAPYSETYCTDGYNGYLDTIFPGKHIFNPHNKNDTFTVEGVNADLRHYPYAGASEQVFSEKVGESSGSPHGFCYRV